MKARFVVDHPKLRRSALALLAPPELRALYQHLRTTAETLTRQLAVARREARAVRRELRRRSDATKVTP